MNRLLACLACLFGLLAAPASAQLAQPGVRNMAVELVSESDAPRSGDTVTLALAMRPNPGWHGYWKNPGDAGAETRVAWRLPPGAAAGELRYPVPDRLTVAGLMNYVFKGPYAHLVDLRVPEGLAPGTPIPIRARVDYLVCTEEICVPEQADVALDLRVGEGAVALDRRARFDAWHRAMPRPLGAEGRFESIGGRLRLAVPLPTTVDVEDPYFFPLTDAAIDHGARQAVSRNGEMLIVETEAGRAADGLSELGLVEECDL
jgi:DsbC/DsbD-like thiol-disulfide interchange protein